MEIDGIVHCQLLDNNQIISAMVYGDRLHRLKDALIRNRSSLVNRKGVLFHHANARPHTA